MKDGQFTSDQAVTVDTDSFSKALSALFSLSPFYSKLVCTIRSYAAAVNVTLVEYLIGNLQYFRSGRLGLDAHSCSESWLYCTVVCSLSVTHHDRRARRPFFVVRFSMNCDLSIRLIKCVLIVLCVNVDGVTAG